MNELGIRVADTLLTHADRQIHTYPPPHLHDLASHIHATPTHMHIHICTCMHACECNAHS